MTGNLFSWRSFLLYSAMSMGVIALTGGCAKSPPKAEVAATPLGTATPAGTTIPAGNEAKAAGTAPPEDDDHGGLHLKPDEVTRLGIVAEPAKGVSHALEASGFGVVLSHEGIAQSAADLRTAAAVARQSRATLERAQRLATGDRRSGCARLGATTSHLELWRARSVDDRKRQPVAR